MNARATIVGACANSKQLTHHYARPMVLPSQNLQRPLDFPCTGPDLSASVAISGLAHKDESTSHSGLHRIQAALGLSRSNWLIACKGMASSVTSRIQLLESS